MATWYRAQKAVPTLSLLPGDIVRCEPESLSAIEIYRCLPPNRDPVVRTAITLGALTLLCDDAELDCEHGDPVGRDPRVPDVGASPRQGMKLVRTI